MVLQKAVVPPPISLLPVSDPRFVRAVDDIALLASGLIASVDATMLALAVPSDHWHSELPLVAWSQRLAASPKLARMLIDTPMFMPAIDALCMAADELHARLASWGWTSCGAPGLCLLTDGNAVILSSARPPVDASCEWLLDLARSTDGAVTLREPCRQGAWSLITAAAGTVH